MLNSAALNDIVIEEIAPRLKDHYDPRQKVIRLSRHVSRSGSIAAIGIAAHEAAHAIQDGKGYPPIKLRNSIAPVVEVVGYFVLPLLLLAVFLGRTAISTLLIDLAVLGFFGVVLFYLVTLPTELDSSSRALRYIRDNAIADETELKGIRQILRLAALTYVVAAAPTFVQFLSLLRWYRRR